MSYRDEKAVDSAFHACYSNGSIYRKLSSIPRTSLEYNLIQKIKHLAYLIGEMIEVERSAKTEIEGFQMLIIISHLGVSLMHFKFSYKQL